MKRIGETEKGREGISEARFFLRGGHLVLLLGFFLGGLMVSFVIGYRAGRSERFDQYNGEELASIPRIVISDDEKPRQLPGRFVDEVYSKLESGVLESNKRRSDNEKGKDKEEAPELKPVKVVSIEELPSQEGESGGLETESGETLGDFARTAKEVENGKLVDSQSKKPADAKAKKQPSKMEEGATIPKDETKQVVATAKEPDQTLGGLFELGNAPGGKGDGAKGQDKADASAENIAAASEPSSSKFVPLVLPKAEKSLLASARKDFGDPAEGGASTSAPVKEQPLVAPSAASVEKGSPNSSDSDKVPSGWYVQLAALEDKAAADELIKKLFANGFQDSHLQPALVSGKRYYRVLVGPEGSTVLAGRLKAQLEREPYVKFKPYLKKVP